MDVLHQFVISQNFMNDQHVMLTMTKLINLGIAFESIIESVKEAIKEHLVKTQKPFTPSSFNSLDLKQIFPHEFLERALMWGIQGEPQNSSKSSYSEQNSDDESNDMDAHTAGGMHMQKAEEHFYNGGLDFGGNDANRQMQMLYQQQQHQRAQFNQHQMNQQQQLQNQQASMKQKNITYQEFVAQSISRINDKSNLRPIIIDGKRILKKKTKKNYQNKFQNSFTSFYSRIF
jgi:hypothetical protein